MEELEEGNDIPAPSDYKKVKARDDEMIRQRGGQNFENN